MSRWIGKGYQNIWLPYTQMQNAPEQLPVIGASDVRIKLSDGRELIDGVSSWWSVAHGYNHPHIIHKMSEQLQKLPHIMMAGLANEQTYKLAARLAKFSPDNLNKVVFADSGSTAVEVAMKIAVQFHLNKRSRREGFVFDDYPKKVKFLSFHGAYHGDSCGAMSISDIRGGMHSRMRDYVPSNYQLPLPKTQNDLDYIDKYLKEHARYIAAVFIEPLVQCAGGMKFYDASILQSIYDLSRKHNLLFIVDECATGFYRTGRRFACDYSSVEPDIMIVGKALTGGMVSLAAAITSDSIFEQFLGDTNDRALMHGLTFMGNPLACSAANASLDLFEEQNYSKMVENIERVMTRELKKCRQIKIVKDVRILGAIGVVEIDLDNFEKIKKIREEFVSEGVWLRPIANVVYVMPPLVIKEVDLIKITKAVFTVLSKLN